MSLPKSVLVAKDAKPGEVYRSRNGHSISGTYLMLTPTETVKRISKKKVSTAMTTTDFREVQMAQEALRGKVVMFTRFLRGVSALGERYEYRSYVSCGLDYELRRLKAKPGYTG